METALEMNLPTAQLEIEIVLAIAFCGWRSGVGDDRSLAGQQKECTGRQNYQAQG